VRRFLLRLPDRVNQNVARGAATREHLLAVAIALFAERGYEATSIEAVLQESGVSRGSLYHHFKGKDVLFEAGPGGAPRPRPDQGSPRGDRRPGRPRARPG